MALSEEHSLPGGETKVSSEVKTSSRSPPFSGVKQKQQSLSAENVRKSQDKRRIKSPFRRPHFDEHRPARIAGKGFQTKLLKNSEDPGNERKAREKEELIKHMSNLPGYLQKMEKVENIQGKALNFGVLDWNRLKEWKYSDNGLPGGNTDVSSSGSSLARDKRQPPSHSSRPYAANEKGFSQDVGLSRLKVMEKDFETSLKNTFDEQKNLHPTNMPSIRSSMGIKFERGMRREIDRVVVSEKVTSSSGFRKNAVPKSVKDLTSGCRKVRTRREELLQSTECLNGKHCSDEQKSLILILPNHSSKPNCQGIVRTSEPAWLFDGQSKEVSQETLSAEVSSEEVRFESLVRSDNPTHAGNLELLNVGSCSSETQMVCSQHKYKDTSTPKSKHSRENGVGTPRSSDYEACDSAAVNETVASPSRRFSFSFGKISRSLSLKENSAVPGTSTTPVTVKSGPIRSELSHRFSSDEIQFSAELYPYILHSCPLPTGKKTKDEPSSRLHSLANVNRTPDKQSSETVSGPTEFDAVQSRTSSPNRRFGFSLSKVKRSLSLKEGLNIPQTGLTTSATVKSNPEASDYSVTQNKTKDSFHNKSRSSPLRRLFNPISKTRGTYQCPSTETSPSLKRISNSFRENESFDDTKPQESMVQALLQVTTKNGLPLFKLVVNNSSDILVATKNMTPSGKQDFDSIYTFYSVHEIKKKSGSWINQVHKEKSYSFGYNVVGQMKGFSRFCTESSVDNDGDRFTQKEFVLYGVDRKQGDGDAPELVPIRELAAIIVRVPYRKSNDDGDERNIGKELTGKEFLEYLGEENFLFGKGETAKFHDTTVILSSADHGLPENGVPSSLIQRWRSGGSCDCGGWDVGCKLQILTNDSQCCSLPEPSVSSSNGDCFDLFNQGRAHHTKPIFRLAPFKKGIYSIEFSSLISLLQALSTCIAAISSQHSFDLSELNVLAEGKLVEESTFSGRRGLHIPSKAQELPKKHGPSPPSSPVGRV